MLTTSMLSSSMYGTEVYILMRHRQGGETSFFGLLVNVGLPAGLTEVAEAVAAAFVSGVLFLAFLFWSFSLLNVRRTKNKVLLSDLKRSQK